MSLYVVYIDQQKGTWHAIHWPYASPPDKPKLGMTLSVLDLMIVWLKCSKSELLSTSVNQHLCVNQLLGVAGRPLCLCIYIHFSISLPVFSLIL